jgi:hypothetical protein
MGIINTPPGDYALVQLFQREVPGLVNPTFHAHTTANVMQANSVLLFYGEKQQRAGKAVTRILPISQIMRPLVFLPDVHPMFSTAASGCAIMNLNKNKIRKHAFMVLRPRDLWHKVFLSQAHVYYLKDGGHEGVEIERKKQEKKAKKLADDEHKKAMEKAEEKKKTRAAAAKDKKQAQAAAMEEKKKAKAATSKTASSSKLSKSGKNKTTMVRKSA